MHKELEARLAALTQRPATYDDVCDTPHSDARGPATPNMVAMEQKNGRPDPVRFDVPDDKVSWKVNYPGYAPVWIGNVPPPADIDAYLNGARHRNPQGRTGFIGPGTLVKADDPDPYRPRSIKAADLALLGYDDEGDLRVVVVRRNPNKCKDPDTPTYAIPGGRQDPGEDAWTTAMREGLEEIFGMEPQRLAGLPPQVLEQMLAAHGIQAQHVHHFYGDSAGERNYGDDPRNTDTVEMQADGFAVLLNPVRFMRLQERLDPAGHRGTGDAENPEIGEVTTIKVKRLIDGPDKDSSIASYGSHQWFLKHLTKALPLYVAEYDTRSPSHSRNAQVTDRYRAAAAGRSDEFPSRPTTRPPNHRDTRIT